MERVFESVFRVARPRFSAALAVALAVAASPPLPAAAREKEDLHAKIAKILGREIPSSGQAVESAPPVSPDGMDEPAGPKAHVRISRVLEPELPESSEPPEPQEPELPESSEPPEPQEQPELQERPVAPEPPPPSLEDALALREEGGPENLAMAAKTLQTLALGGGAAAQYALARACERGEGLKAPSPRQAVFWADRAASAGCADAHVLLGLYWTVGFGVDRDEGAARRAFAAAAAAGDPVGAALLAATGAAGDSEKALAARARLSDFAPFAGLVERAGLSGAVLAASVPGRPPVFRTRPDCPENASNPDSPCLSE